MTILKLIGMVFVIIWEMFHGRIYLSSMLLLLQKFRLELMSGLEIISGTIKQIVWWNIANWHGESLCLFFFSHLMIFCVCLWKQNYMAPFCGWHSTASRLESHFEEGVYFLPLSSHKLLLLILISEGWKTESILEPPSGFEHRTPELRI